MRSRSAIQASSSAQRVEHCASHTDRAARSTRSGMARNSGGGGTSALESVDESPHSRAPAELGIRRGR
jgi:hypothetical protein